LKITHFSNSFISVRTKVDHLVCDPWMGKANTGGWQSFPEYSVDQLALSLYDVKYVYISHLHEDHFNIETLRLLRLVDREFVIKRFQSPLMRERLKKIGVTRIHELEPFSVNRLGSFEVAIFPQMTSNSSGLHDDVNFDMDTSIAIKAGGIVFFNQVDNPLSNLDFSRVRDWILSYFGKVDIACLMCGAASEYPHLFIGIDQATEKRKVIDDSLKKLIGWLELLEPIYYFPAGGTYLIPGWLSFFGHNIAQPNFLEISNLIKQLKLNVQPLALEGGYAIDLSASDSHFRVEQELMPIESELLTAILKHSKDAYDYEVVIPPTFEKILELLDAAKVNWLQNIQTKGLNITQSIIFEIYSELSVKDGILDVNRRLGSYKLFASKSFQNGSLTIHIDQRALFGCLTRRFLWNGVLGSLCLFERKPNKHFPTDFFSINYLIERKN